MLYFNTNVGATLGTAGSVTTTSGKLAGEQPGGFVQDRERKRTSAGEATGSAARGQQPPVVSQVYLKPLSSMHSPLLKVITALPPLKLNKTPPRITSGNQTPVGKVVITSSTSYRVPAISIGLSLTVTRTALEQLFPVSDSPPDRSQRAADHRQVERLQRVIAGIVAQLKETYDRIRAAIDERIRQAGRAIRPGSEAAGRSGRHVESLLVEVDQAIRYGGQDRRPIGLGQPLRPVPHSEVRQDALGDVFSVSGKSRA